MKIKHIITSGIVKLILWFGVNPLSGQDLDSLLNVNSDLPVAVGFEAFKGTRVGNGQSTTLPGAGELHMFIGHRFGKVSGGFYEFFGLDQATMRMGFDYGINNWLAAGFGRSTLEKTWDIYAKTGITRQASGNSPLNVTLYAASSINTLKNVYPSENDGFGDRISLTFKGLISRKFERFSLMIAPIYLHNFYDPGASGAVDIFSTGMAARVRLSKFLDLTAEYYASIIKPPYEISNPFTLGLDIDTGGHLFQLVFTNSQGMFEKALLSNTNGKWTQGDIYFGFNLVRTFYMKK
jgi:hypothetical protein